MHTIRPKPRSRLQESQLLSTFSFPYLLHSKYQALAIASPPERNGPVHTHRSPRLCATAPAMLSQASILAKRSSVPDTMASAACGPRRSTSKTIASALAISLRMRFFRASPYFWPQAHRLRNPERDEGSSPPYALTGTGDDGYGACVQRS